MHTFFFIITVRDHPSFSPVHKAYSLCLPPRAPPYPKAYYENVAKLISYIHTLSVSGANYIYQFHTHFFCQKIGANKF